MNEPFGQVPPPIEPPPPAVLGGYRLVELLGRGGMGEVYRAERDGPGGYRRRAAIKRILPRYQNDPTLRARFLAEARTNARLEHPNVVQVLDFGDQPEPYLALEFIEGTTVARVLKQCADAGVRIPPAAAAFLVAEAATGLDYAHRRQDEAGRDLQIIHRDVSPQNILISIDGAVKISDFGIARAADNQLRTAAGISVGKLAYMAPEQARGQPIDRRADVFALGVVLWEVLLVRPLIPRNDSNAAIQMLLAGRFDPPSRIDPRLPPVIDRIVLDALAVDPARRTATAGQLAQSLRGFVHAMAPGFDGSELVRMLAQLVPDVRWQVPMTPPRPAWPGEQDSAAGHASAHPSLGEEDGATRVFLDPTGTAGDVGPLPMAGAGRQPSLPIPTPAVPSFAQGASAVPAYGYGNAGGPSGPMGYGSPSGPSAGPPMGYPGSAGYPSAMGEGPPGGYNQGGLDAGMPPRPETRASQAAGSGPPIPVSPVYAPQAPPAQRAPEPVRTRSTGRNLLVWIATPLILMAMLVGAVAVYYEVTHDDHPEPIPGLAGPSAPVSVTPVDPAVALPVPPTPTPPSRPMAPPQPAPLQAPEADPYLPAAQGAVNLAEREVQRCLHRYPNTADQAVADVLFSDATGRVTSATVDARSPRGASDALRACIIAAITINAHFSPVPAATGVSRVGRTWAVPRSSGGGGGGGGPSFPFTIGGG